MGRAAVLRKSLAATVGVGLRLGLVAGGGTPRAGAETSSAQPRLYEHRQSPRPS